MVAVAVGALAVAAVALGARHAPLLRRPPGTRTRLAAHSVSASGGGRRRGTGSLSWPSSGLTEAGGLAGQPKWNTASGPGGRRARGGPHLARHGAANFMPYLREDTGHGPASEGTPLTTGKPLAV